jgi:DNA-binding NarL/FixJ family response regulator
MKPVVLFVDDEPNLISGLRRATRQFAEQWEVYFAGGGEEALTIIPQKRINTVVTDMRMPGIGGAQLLGSISRQWPGIFRLVLSGEADADSACQIVGRSHRFLSKPCDYEVLYDAIQRPFDYRTELKESSFEENWSYFDRLRAAPGNLQKLQALLDVGTIDMVAVCALIMSDPSLAARTLQIANSAYFGRPFVTSDIAAAAKTLGADVIRTIVAKGRLGGEDACPSTERNNLVQLALLAQSQTADMGGGKKEQALAYTTALFSKLGHMGSSFDPDEIVGMGEDQNCIPQFVSALFGFPHPLVRNLQNLSLKRSSDAGTLELANIIATGALLGAETSTLSIVSKVE